jgi:hypothetical protein
VLHYAGLSIPIDPLRTAAVATAFLEFAIDCTAGLVDYSDLKLNTTTGVAVWFGWPRYITCGPGYSVVQVPLTAFRDDNGEPVDATTLTGDLQEFWLFGNWAPGQVYIDEVRIRY